MIRHLHTFVAVVLAASWACADEAEPNVRLFEWERGFAVQPREPDDMVVYLWFISTRAFAISSIGKRRKGNTYGRTSGRSASPTRLAG